MTLIMNSQDNISPTAVERISYMRSKSDCVSNSRSNQRTFGKICSQCQKYYNLYRVHLTHLVSDSIITWKFRSCLHDIPCLTTADTGNVTVPSNEDYVQYISKLRKHVSIPSRIPKAARIFAAEVLSEAIDATLITNKPTN